MIPKVLAAISLAGLLGACVQTGDDKGLGLPAAIPARLILPPQDGVEVGSLYYVKEQPTESLSRPANLEPLCLFKLSDYGVDWISRRRVADFEILDNLDASGALSKANFAIASAGLSGSVSNYYEMKLTNVAKVGISRDDAQTAFQRLRAGPKCASWFNNVSDVNAWAIYQIESVYVGDLVFSRKRSAALNASVSAKLAVAEPKVEADLKRMIQSGLSGKALAFAFIPIRRN